MPRRSAAAATATAVATATATATAVAVAVAMGTFLVVVVGAAGCPAPGDHDGPDGGPGGPDGGPGTGGTVDVGCAADEECGAGTICDLATGDCVDGLDCTQNNALCDFCGDPAADCGFGTAPAYCSASGGVCRRAKQECGACADDSECAESASGLPSVCTGGFCAEGCGACPAGFTCSGGGCVPVAGSDACDGALPCRNGETCPDGQTCTGLGVCLPLCNSDAECGAGEICELDAGPRQQQCVPGCPLGDRVTQDGVELVCHADGHYGAPCLTEGSAEGCPTGTECDASGVCQRAGCQDDSECPLVRTFCDVGSGTCVDGCNSADDCGAFELCGDDGQCHAQGCRGKDVSCDLGEWCCGTEAFTDVSTCPVAEGECFLTPDPWCRTCASNDDCADVPSSCYELQKNDENGQAQSIGKFCAPPCETNLDCPRGIECVDGLPTDQDGVTVKGCIATLCAGIAAAR